MQVNHYYARRTCRGPPIYPVPDAVRNALNVADRLMSMRAAPPAALYTGPLLFEPRAAGAHFFFFLSFFDCVFVFGLYNEGYFFVCYWGGRGVVFFFSQD